MRSASLHAKPEERKPRIPNWLSDDEVQAARRARLRKQSTVLGAIFAFLAMVVFLATRVMGPSVIVHLDGGQGTVVVDGEEVGRTDDVLHVPFGKHEIRVLPDADRAIADPPVIVREFAFAWDPVSLVFTQIDEASRPQKNTADQTEDEEP